MLPNRPRNAYKHQYFSLENPEDGFRLVKFMAEVIEFRISYAGKGRIPTLPLDDGDCLTFSTWAVVENMAETARLMNPEHPAYDWLAYNARVRCHQILWFLRQDLNLSQVAATFTGLSISVLARLPDGAQVGALEVGRLTMTAAGPDWKEVGAGVFRSSHLHPLTGTMGLEVAVGAASAEGINGARLDEAAPMARLEARR